MTILIRYVTNKKPADWKDLFREATNVAFMVKYMFRESVTLAKTIFTFIAEDKNQYKKLPQAAEAQATIKKLVSSTLQAYGSVGLYDPAQLATIDFLNHPEELVALVQAGKESNATQPEMLLLADIATNWMRYMIDRGFPPLTPHHTQSFVVLMMARFFGDVVKPPSPAESSEGAKGMGEKSWVEKIMGEKSKLNAKTFIAQMATGEGKSIVIAMLAVFMVKQFGLKVHVLENNEGLLLRDYATNAPFYDRFGIKSGKDLSDPDTQICYCLKAPINKQFLRNMMEGKLVLDRTVLIVDEVDDLIVNERPNAHYVKPDREYTPSMIKCLAAIKAGKGIPAGVDETLWYRAVQDMETAQNKQEGVHYRIITNEKNQATCVQLDASGQVPKVTLTSPWLKALNYLRCGIEPSAESHYACVCTPYVFNRYAAIFWVNGLGRRQGRACLPDQDVQRGQVQCAPLPGHMHQHAAKSAHQPWRRAAQER
jgi:hypothetical protein